MSEPHVKPSPSLPDSQRSADAAGRERPPTRLTRSLIGVFVVFAALYLARDLLIPIALAIFLSFLLAPLVRAVQARGLPRIPSVFVVATFSISALSLGGWFVGSQALGLFQELPAYRDNIVEKARGLSESITGKFRPVMQTIDAVSNEISRPEGARSGVAAVKQTPEAASTSPSVAHANGLGNNSLQFVRAALFPLLHPFEVVGLAAVFLIFFLVYREDLRDRIIWVCGRAHLSLTTTALTDAGSRVSRYFGGLVLANGLHGLAVTLGLLALGFPNAIVFGVIAALLRFIPFLGPAVAAILPTTLALGIFDGWAKPVLVVVLFISVDLLSANMLEPWLYGARTGASPTAIILSTVVWTWLWGGIGLVLATPITVCLVVLGKYVPQFQALYVLLGDEPVLEPHARVYQRLLAMDRTEALQILKSAAKNDPPEKVMSELMVPALSLLAVDSEHGSQDASRDKFAGEVVDAVLPPTEAVATSDEQRASDAKDSAIEAARPGASVLLIPAHGPHDELAARILERIRRARGGATNVASPHLLVAELLENIRSHRPEAICVVTVTADNIGRIELLCRRISEQGLDCPLIAGVWDFSADPERLRRRLGRHTRVRLCLTLAETLQALESSVPLKTAPAAPAANPSAASTPPTAAVAVLAS